MIALTINLNNLKTLPLSPLINNASLLSPLNHWHVDPSERLNPHGQEF
jgi:hypothetical protein